MNQCEPLWTNLIQFEPIWSSLIHFGQIWSNLIQNKMAIFIQFVNVTTLYRNIFWLVRNPIWASLIKFDPFWTDLIKKIQNKTAIFILFVNVTTFYSIILWSNRNWGKWQTRQRQQDKTWQRLRSFKQDCLSLKIFRSDIHIRIREHQFFVKQMTLEMIK